jgi:hypothetical protein
MIPATAAKTPDRMYASIFVFFVGIPDSVAPEALSPTHKVFALSVLVRIRLAAITATSYRIIGCQACQQA